MNNNDHQSFPSLRALARAVPMSVSGLSKLLQRDGCPLDDSPPWTLTDLDLLRVFRSYLQENRAADAGKMLTPGRLADWQLKTERMKKVKLEREILEGKYLHVQVTRQECTAAMMEFKHDMLKVASDLGQRVPKHIRQKVDAAIRDRLTRLSTRMAASCRDGGANTDGSG